MRKILIMLAILFCVNMGYSQEGIGENREKFMIAQFNEVCNVLSLSKDKAEALRPIYFEFQRELHSSRGERPKHKRPPMKPSEEEIDSLNRAKLTTGVKIATLRLEYYDKFRKILSPSQIDDMYRVEREVMRRINREFMERRMERRKGNE